MTEKILFSPKCHGCVFFCSEGCGFIAGAEAVAAAGASSFAEVRVAWRGGRNKRKVELWVRERAGVGCYAVLPSRIGGGQRNFLPLVKL